MCFARRAAPFASRGRDVERAQGSQAPPHQNSGPYFDPRPLIEDNRFRSSASSSIFNAQLSYRVSKAVRLTLDVFDLLDAQVGDTPY